MATMLAIGKELKAPAERVWRLITDTRAWPRWGPTVRAVDSPERFIRAGLTGRVCTPVGLWVPFTIETFEPNHYWDWRVGGLSATGHRVEAIDENRCRLSFTVPIWAAGYSLVCRLALNRIQRLSA